MVSMLQLSSMKGEKILSGTCIECGVSYAKIRQSRIRHHSASRQTDGEHYFPQAGTYTVLGAGRTIQAMSYSHENRIFLERASDLMTYK